MSLRAIKEAAFLRLEEQGWGGPMAARERRARSHED